jgi:hypothetical protein
MTTKRQQATIGAIIKIPLGDGYHTYAQILPERECAVFDARTTSDLEISDIVGRPVLFRVAIYRHALTLGSWPKVGKAPLRDEFEKPCPKFMQDILLPTSFSIYLGGVIRSATRDECIDLERVAVWESEHVKSRICDHYNQVPNKWVESLKIK